MKTNSTRMLLVILMIVCVFTLFCACGSGKETSADDKTAAEETAAGEDTESLTEEELDAEMEAELEKATTAEEKAEIEKKYEEKKTASKSASKSSAKDSKTSTESKTSTSKTSGSNKATGTQSTQSTQSAQSNTGKQTTQSTQSGQSAQSPAPAPKKERTLTVKSPKYYQGTVYWVKIGKQTVWKGKTYSEQQAWLRNQEAEWSKKVAAGTNTDADAEELGLTTYGSGGEYIIEGYETYTITESQYYDSGFYRNPEKYTDYTFTWND